MSDEVDGNLRVDSLINGKRGTIKEHADLIMDNSFFISTKLRKKSVRWCFK